MWPAAIFRPDNYITIAVDLVSPAEHGYDSRVWLYTDSRELAQKLMETMPKIIADMPTPEVPESSWRDSSGSPAPWRRPGSRSRF